jgi:hypothetical protein
MKKKEQLCHIRIPAEIYQSAVRVAEAERRSVSGQLNLWIERGMPAELLDEIKADISTALAGGEK